MPKPELLVVCPPGHYLLRNLDAISDLARISIADEVPAIQRLTPDAEIILYAGLTANISFPEVWRHARKVRWVHSLSAGIEKLLTPEIASSPVPMTNARGVFKRPLAEFAVLGMLYFYKEIRRLIESQRAHRWDDFLVDTLKDKIMGIVGYGEIGRECALMASPLGVKVYALRRKTELSSSDPIVEKVFAPGELHAMLRECDVVVAAAPMTPETRHMLGAPEFAIMKPSAILINIGRGAVIDEAALIQVLRERRLRGAALDVFEQEPLPAEHPFWNMENVLVSPHNTDRTRNPDWLDLAMQCFIENFRRYIAGQPLLNVVDKRAGY
jgi:phosphoglycerate dehydrogenase-like enzyme